MKYIKNFNELNEKKVGVNKIDNMLSYLDGMSYGINDKLFFINEIDFDCVVDFGAADGLLLEEIKKISPSVSTIAYDIDTEMLDVLKGKNVDYVTNSLSEVFEQIKYFDSPILVLSSVIHEVYSYSHSDSEITLFWNMLFGSNFKYIVIRDMISMDKFDNMIPSDSDINNLYNETNNKLISSFENIWGSVKKNYKTLLHYLLKYKYINNWEREVNENYLMLTIENLKNLIPKSWSIKYDKHYILEYFKNTVKNDFNIDITEPTHIKMIIQNNNFKPNEMIKEYKEIDWDNDNFEEEEFEPIMFNVGDIVRSVGDDLFWDYEKWIKNGSHKKSTIIEVGHVKDMPSIFNSHINNYNGIVIKIRGHWPWFEPNGFSAIK